LFFNQEQKLRPYSNRVTAALKNPAHHTADLGLDMVEDLIASITQRTSPTATSEPTSTYGGESGLAEA
jgi:hypothetical protein